MDHIIPKSRGGPDTYQNLCCSCATCNDRKKNRTPDESGMKLLAVPYVPNPAARLILSGRAIIADQMDYLKSYANLRKTRRED
jgi:5-methylcytosine-specific restriction endonuclease McrA